MRIMQNNLKRQYELHAEEYREKAIRVLDSGWYVLGEEVKHFEQEWARYVGVEHCVGVASGLDALILAFRIIGIAADDEVIVCSNAYIACVMGITINGGSPVFVEPDEYFNIDVSKLEQAVTAKTKAILAVHLFGQCCNMDEIMRIAQKYGIGVIEDCAQAHGSHWRGKRAGSFGELSCFSFYPSKGCGAFGDGGAITTNNSEIAQRARIIRNYGSEKRYYNCVVGVNSRLDEIQAGLLRVKLAHLDQLNTERILLARRYSEDISNPLILKPEVQQGADSSWHQYVVRCKQRTELVNYMKDCGIETTVHYPIPPHLSEAYSYLGYQRGDFPIAEKYADEMLSFPIYNGMTSEEQQCVINAANCFSS